MISLFPRSLTSSLASLFVIVFLILTILSCSGGSDKGAGRAVEVGNPVDIAPSGTTGGKFSDPGVIKGPKSLELTLTAADFGEVSAVILNVESAELVFWDVDGSKVVYSSPLESVERRGFFSLEAGQRQLLSVAVQQDVNFPTSRLHIDLLVKANNPGSVTVDGRKIDLASFEKTEARLVRIDIGELTSVPDLDGRVVVERSINRDQVLEPRQSQQQSPPPSTNGFPPSGGQAQLPGPAYVLKTALSSASTR